MDPILQEFVKNNDAFNTRNVIEYMLHLSRMSDMRRFANLIETHEQDILSILNARSLDKLQHYRTVAVDYKRIYTNTPSLHSQLMASLIPSPNTIASGVMTVTEIPHNLLAVWHRQIMIAPDDRQTIGGIRSWLLYIYKRYQKLHVPHRHSGPMRVFPVIVEDNAGSTRSSSRNITLHDADPYVVLNYIAPRNWSNVSGLAIRRAKQLIGLITDVYTSMSTTSARGELHDHLIDYIPAHDYVKILALEDIVTRRGILNIALASAQSRELPYDRKSTIIDHLTTLSYISRYVVSMLTPKSLRLLFNAEDPHKIMRLLTTSTGNRTDMFYCNHLSPDNVKMIRQSIYKRTRTLLKHTEKPEDAVIQAIHEIGTDTGIIHMMVDHVCTPEEQSRILHYQSQISTAAKYMPLDTNLDFIIRQGRSTLRQAVDIIIKEKPGLISPGTYVSSNRNRYAQRVKYLIHQIQTKMTPADAKEAMHQLQSMTCSISDILEGNLSDSEASSLRLIMIDLAQRIPGGLSKITFGLRVDGMKICVPARYSAGAVIAVGMLERNRHMINPHPLSTSDHSIGILSYEHSTDYANDEQRQLLEPLNIPPRSHGLVKFSNGSIHTSRHSNPTDCLSVYIGINKEEHGLETLRERLDYTLDCLEQIAKTHGYRYVIINTSRYNLSMMESPRLMNVAQFNEHISDTIIATTVHARRGTTIQIPSDNPHIMIL